MAIGAQALGKGVVGGLTGIVWKPLEGAQADGVTGFARAGPPGRWHRFRPCPSQTHSREDTISNIPIPNIWLAIPSLV